MTATEPTLLKTPRPEKLVARLKDGFAWNPLLKFPRNLPCPCGAPKKFKHCHANTIPRAIPEKLAAEFRHAMRDPELVRFINDDTKDAVETQVLAKDA